MCLVLSAGMQKDLSDQSDLKTSLEITKINKTSLDGGDSQLGCNWEAKYEEGQMVMGTPEFNLKLIWYHKILHVEA